MDMEYVVIGKILNTHGIKGDLKIVSYSDFDNERFAKGSKVYLGEQHLEMVVKAYRKHQDFLLVSFVDYEDINLVEKYKNYLIYKSKDDIKPLKKGEYYFSDLRDLDVFIGNEKVGKVLYVEEGFRNNNLRIQTNDGKQHLVAYLPQFVLNVDLSKRKIQLFDMEGLL